MKMPCCLFFKLLSFPAERSKKCACSDIFRLGSASRIRQAAARWYRLKCQFTCSSFQLYPVLYSALFNSLWFYPLSSSRLFSTPFGSWLLFHFLQLNIGLREPLKTQSLVETLYCLKNTMERIPFKTTQPIVKLSGSLSGGLIEVDPQ